MMVSPEELSNRMLADFLKVSVSVIVAAGVSGNVVAFVQEAADRLARIPDESED